MPSQGDAENQASIRGRLETRAIDFVPQCGTRTPHASARAERWFFLCVSSDQACETENSSEPALFGPEANVRVALFSSNGISRSRRAAEVEEIPGVKTRKNWHCRKETCKVTFWHAPNIHSCQKKAPATLTNRSMILMVLEVWVFQPSTLMYFFGTWDSL